MNPHRPNRGPLRALPIVNNQTPIQDNSVRLNRHGMKQSTRTEKTAINMDSNEKTPVIRVSVPPSSSSTSLTKTEIIKNSFNMDNNKNNTDENRISILMPLRSSSYKSIKNFQTNEDIRSHFPIRTISAKNISTENITKINESDNLNNGIFSTTIATITSTSKTTDSITRIIPTITSTTDTISLNTTNHISFTRKRPFNYSGIHTSPKLKRLSDNFYNNQKIIHHPDKINFFQNSNDKHLTMGSDVKTHPRYNRRKSNASNDIDTNCSNHNDIDHNKQHLAPICPVPMPEGFPLQLPIRYSAVSLPWDYNHLDKLHNSTLQCNVQTQTSPNNLNEIKSNGKIRRRRHTGLGRQSSGTIQMLENLKRKFGHLRRAISADRLNRNSQTSEELKTSKTENEICVENLNKSIQSEYNANNNDDKHIKSEIINTEEKSKYSRLNYEIVKKHIDGSINVQLKRSSIREQFGFFIARDHKGIYVSRLGSVKCAAKLWDIIHVGDRILEVQNMKCDHFDVDDVQNIIRGCEIVEFRIKPNRSNYLSHHYL